MSSSISSRRSGRLTPYGHTPRKNRREATTGSEGQTSDSPFPGHTSGERNVALKKLVAKTCHIYTVSPLWKFLSTRGALKSYSDQLTVLLDAVSPNPNASQRAVDPCVGVVSVVKDFNPDGSHAVQVTVTQSNHRTSAVVCRMLMCRPLQPQAMQNGFTYLPLMLVHGLSSVAQVVLEWLRNSFDCCVAASKVDESCLQMLAVKYATTQSEVKRRVGGLKLLYRLPDSVREAGLTSVSLEIPYESLLSLNKENSLYKMTDKLIHQHFHLKLSSLSLASVTTPLLHTTCDGVIKFHDVDHVMPVLSAVQEAMLQ